MYHQQEEHQVLHHQVHHQVDGEQLEEIKMSVYILIPVIAVIIVGYWIFFGGDE
jgi:hypothetical protein